MGQAAIPIVMAVAAAGAQGYNTYRTAKKQDQALARGLKEQAEIRRVANARSGETLDKFEGSTPIDETESLSDKYRRQLRLKQGVAFQNIASPGDISGATEGRIVDKTAAANDYAGALEGFASIIDGTREQRRGEQFDIADLARTMGVIRSEANSKRYLTDLKMRGIQRNPWIDLLAAGLQGASTGMSMKAPITPIAGGAGTGAPITGGAWSTYAPGTNPYLVSGP
jgi:uncharacterized protein YerC